MTLLKSLRRELKNGNSVEAEKIINKMIMDGYPKSLIDSSRKQYKDGGVIKAFPVESLDPMVRNVLIIGSPGDKMTNYYRADFFHEVLNSSSLYSSQLTNTSEVTKEMVKAAHIIYVSRGGVTKEILHELEIVRDKGALLIFDADDYVFDENIIASIRHIATNSKRLADMQKHARRLAQIANLSDVILTSTYYLSKCASLKFGKSTFAIPNVIKNNIIAKSNLLIEKRLSRKTNHIRIGYFSGTKSHEEDFNQVTDIMYELMCERNDVEFLVCGELAVDRFKVFGSRFIKLPLQNYEKMHEYLSTTHINIAPLEISNIFVHGKSELKIFDAAIYQIPTLASRTDSYSSTIVDGFNGFLCDYSQDWKNKIKYLLDNPAEIIRIGGNARKTLVERFVADVVKVEYLALIDGLIKNSCRKNYPELNAPCLRFDKISKYSISLVTILYKKEKELPYFLESLRRQDFDYPFELIVVNDCSPDNSINILMDFDAIYKSLPGSNKNLQIKIINLDNNIGNCEARNIGINASQADIVSVVDADCVLNRSFLKAHFDAHASNDCDVAIGPKGIETNGKHPLHILSLVDMSGKFSLDNASPQDVHNQASFINTVTRNLSFRKNKVKELIGEKLFDKDFSYSRDPKSGFGWEDVEFGVRLHKAGAKFIFINNSASIHISHDATENVGDKAFRSLKNFSRLASKHPDLKSLSRIWYVKTLDAIENWCIKTDKERYSSEAQRIIESLKMGHDLQDNARKVFSNHSKLRKIKIVTSRWHCPHQYELYKLGCEFYLIEGLKHNFFNEWEYRKRPLPYNAKFINLKNFRASDFDLALIHFDENVLRPDLCNDKVPMEWGDAFEFLSKLDLPKIYLCHGTPQFYGQYNSQCDEKLFGIEIQDTKNQLVDFVKDDYVVCNSSQAKAEWGFKNSGVIYHGFTASEFSYFNPSKDQRFVDKNLKVLSLPINALLARPLYNGLNLYNSIVDSIDLKNIKIENLSVEDPCKNYLADMSLWSQAKYRLYCAELLKYNCYLNTTKRSPMPRTRAEAMMSGSIVISTPDHDIDKFIVNNENGFIINNSNDAVDCLRLLSEDVSLRKSVAIFSYETALDVFSQEKYLASWADLILSKVK